MKSLSGTHTVRPYWSEADLVHSMANMVQQGLVSRGMSEVVHVAPYLGTDEDLFGKKTVQIEAFLRAYNKATGRSRSKLAPDITVVNPSDTSDLLGCVEVKLYLGTNYWKSKMSDLEDSYKRVRLLRGKVFPEAFLAVAFDPQMSSLNQQKELTSKLNTLESKGGQGFVLRYGC